MTTLYIFLAVYIFGLIGISLYLARRSNDEDYLIAGRNRGMWQIMSSKFAYSAGSAWFITFTGFAYLFGLSTFMAMIGLVASYTVFAFWVVPRIYKTSKEHHLYTQGDFVKHKTGSNYSKVLVDVCAIGMSIIWLTVALIGGAKVIEHLGILSYTSALIITSAVILVYLLASGFRAVVVTDVIQTIVVLLLLVIPIGFILSSGTELSSIINVDTDTISFGTIGGFLVYGIFSVFALPDRYQLTFAAKNSKTASKGMFASLLPIIVMFSVVMFIGLYVRSLGVEIDPDLVFINFFFEYMPAWFASVGAFLLLAGLMSSADTGIYNAASYITFLKKRGDNKKHVRMMVVLVTVVLTIFAYFVRDIISASIFGAFVTLIPSVAMIYAVAGGKNARVFNMSIYGGTVAVLGGVTLLGISLAVAIIAIIGGAIGLGAGVLYAKFKS